MVKKKKLQCRQLNERQAEELARLIIQETENRNWHNAGRKRRIPAPSGGILVF